MGGNAVLTRDCEAGRPCARHAAAARLATMGLPKRRDEYWKFTDPAPLTGPVGAAAASAAESTPFAPLNPLRVVLNGGRLDTIASDPLALDGLDIAPIDAARQPGHWAYDLIGLIEADVHDPVRRPLAARAVAEAQGGVVIRARAVVSQPVEIIYREEAGVSERILHHYIMVEEDAALTLLESGGAAARIIATTEIALARGARLDHLRVQGPGSVAARAGHLLARLGPDADLRSFTLDAGEGLTRNEIVIDFTGPSASAHVAGATVGTKGVHQDDTVFIRHGAPDCESRQVYKKVLAGAARGVFQGKILVAPGAQRTDGYQLSQALLLDEESQFLAKPELEIYADDVKCSHGSTTGALDADTLFYLLARGVPRPKAEALLVLAFLSEALAEIASDDAREAVQARLEDVLERALG